MQYDLIVVGSGFCGSTITHLAAKEGKKVLLIEKRNHIAGNMYDKEDSSGALVHKYGPHIFHTNNKEVYNFLIGIGSWEEFNLRCKAVIDGIPTPTPFNFSTIDTFFNKKKAEVIKECLKNEYTDKETIPVIDLINSENCIIKEYGMFLFEKDYRPYTAKQWGVEPEEIDPSVLKRVPVCLSYKDEYFSDKYQMLPKSGYTEFFNKMLNHPNIDVLLGCNALNRIKINYNQKMIYFDNKKLNIPLVYTGAIDSLFEEVYGKLPYRSLRFDYQIYQRKSYQDAPVVAYPQVKDFTRITEYTKLPVQNIGNKTVIAVEYPVAADDRNNNEPFYPILTNDNLEKYNKYQELAVNISNLFLCGRLADYKYYNMDDAISRAFNVYKQIKQ